MTKFFVYMFIAVVSGLCPPLALILLLIAMSHYKD